MSGFQLFSLLVVCIAAFSFISHKYINLPESVGMTAMGMLASFGLVLLGLKEPLLKTAIIDMVASVNFYEVVFHGILPLILFSGALHLDLDALARYRLPVLLLSTVAVGISTLVIGWGVHFLFQIANFNISLLYCLLFGALISPTDPIAVMGIFKKAQVPVSLETKIAGESLFNDGTAIVVFLTLIAFISEPPTPLAIAELFLTEVLGALVIGGVIGVLGQKALLAVHSYTVEIFITLAMVLGGYALAEASHAAAPLCVVVMGLILGRRGKTSICESTKLHLFNFWELTDELLTLVLFGLVGLKVSTLDLTWMYAFVSIATIAVVLMARFISVVIPLLLLTPLRGFSSHAATLLTWGGLRGGVSIALALSLPNFEGKDLIICMTYFVVLFSIVVQGTTLGPLLKKLRY